MAEGPTGDRTEKATPKRRQEARKKGQVAQSNEIPSVLILISALGVFYFAGSWLFWNLSDFLAGIYGNLGSLRLNDVAGASAFSLDIFKRFFSFLIPFFLPILVAGIAGNVFQIGFELHGETMKPGFDKLDPIAGMKKFFSLKALVELIKSLIKVLIIGGIGYALVKSEMGQFPALVNKDVAGILIFIGRAAFKICFFVCLALIVLAVLDYLYQRWQYEENLKMTKQEVKDERKQTEGDPKIKARIRSMQMEMAQRRMMEAVPGADVVITNPTHLAVALKFDSSRMIAPRLLAKGAGHIAARIREIAAENGVPLVENKPLAQTLFKMVDIGDYIPVELYRAVAEVLAYVYRLKGMQTTA